MDGKRFDRETMAALACLPCTRFGKAPTAAPDLASAWLLDQVTLLSDREVVEVVKLVAR